MHAESPHTGVAPIPSQAVSGKGLQTFPFARAGSAGLRAQPTSRPPDLEVSVVGEGATTDTTIHTYFRGKLNSGTTRTSSNAHSSRKQGGRGGPAQVWRAHQAHLKKV